MNDDGFRDCISRGDVDGVRRALEAEPELANRTIRWHLNQDNQSDPLHYVSDCVGQGWLTNGTEGEIAALLLEHGAALEGSEGRESPLIAAASLGAERVAVLLIDAGAELERRSIFGSRALHWAAWIGLPATVERLAGSGADIEARCTEFGATPLFWAVHGYGPKGHREKGGQVEAARTLIAAGAEIETLNKQGLSAIDLAGQCSGRDMYELLIAGAS
jgi:ankyrin repeat protein